LKLNMGSRRPATIFRGIDPWGEKYGYILYES
jgi:hypothetical protein